MDPVGALTPSEMAKTMVDRRRSVCSTLAVPVYGALIGIEPLEDEHRGELAAAAKDSRIWMSTLINLVDEADFNQWWVRALAERKTLESVPFAIRSRLTGGIIGSTRFGVNMIESRCLEVGGTWLVPQVWGQGANAEVKLLMLARAFETAECLRVEFKTAVTNARSRASLVSLGATEEGILRRRHLVGGQGHDSVYFSLLAEEWPRARRRLLERLGQNEPGAFGSPVD